MGELTAGSKVADYQEPLAESCQDYQEFVDAYDDLPSGQGPGLAPGFTLIFCAPVSEPNTPTSVYNSELCSSARSSDPDLPSLR